jgi:hypothetical protein
MKIWKQWKNLYLSVGEALPDFCPSWLLETQICKPGDNSFCPLAKLPVLAGLAIVLFARASLATTPFYVQGNFAAPQTPQTNVTVTYPAAQTAGDLSVVIVGWNDASAQVSSVTDSKGNVYQLAVGPTVLTGSDPLSQAILLCEEHFGCHGRR